MASDNPDKDIRLGRWTARAGRLTRSEFSVLSLIGGINDIGGLLWRKDLNILFLRILQ
jgi:hypothetical protein